MSTSTRQRTRLRWQSLALLRSARDWENQCPTSARFERSSAAPAPGPDPGHRIVAKAPTSSRKAELRKGIVRIAVPGHGRNRSVVEAIFQRYGRHPCRGGAAAPARLSKLVTQGPASFHSTECLVLAARCSVWASEKAVYLAVRVSIGHWTRPRRIGMQDGGKSVRISMLSVMTVSRNWGRCLMASRCWSWRTSTVQP